MLAAAIGTAPAASPETRDINEGELRFLAEAPAEPVHLHDAHVVISEESLRSGWVQNRQCHYRLDRVQALQVVFNPGRVRHLRVEQSRNIARAWVEGASVQVQDVGADAVLCISGETRALSLAPDGHYAWHAGPYMRRFLDGYFPMQVRLTLDYPASLLRLQSLSPAELGLRAVSNPDQLRLDVFFEGRMEIEARFARAGG